MTNENSIGPADIGLKTAMFEFCTITINGVDHDVLLTTERIKSVDLGDDDIKLYVFETRGRDDDPEVVCTAENHVIVNYCYTILSLDDLLATVRDQQDQYIEIDNLYSATAVDEEYQGAEVDQVYSTADIPWSIIDYLETELEPDVFEAFMSNRNR